MSTAANHAGLPYGTTLRIEHDVPGTDLRAGDLVFVDPGHAVPATLHCSNGGNLNLPIRAALELLTQPWTYTVLERQVEPRLRLLT